MTLPPMLFCLIGIAKQRNMTVTIQCKSCLNMINDTFLTSEDAYQCSINITGRSKVHFVV